MHEVQGGATQRDAVFAARIFAARGISARGESGAVLGVDSVANWSSYFYEPGFSFGGTQFSWGYTMVGHAPFGKGEDQDWQGETTRIGAPIVPVSLDLRNADGTPRFVNGQRLFSDATQFVPFVLASPVFSNTTYDSSERPTQFTDAIQRAEFFHMSDDDWHTLLKPRVATPRTMVLLKGTYQFALNTDGSCCLFVLIDENTFGNALFPAVPTDTTTPIGAAENAGTSGRRIFPHSCSRTRTYFRAGSAACWAFTRMILSRAAHRMAGRNDATAELFELDYPGAVQWGIPRHHGAEPRNVGDV